MLRGEVRERGREKSAKSRFLAVFIVIYMHQALVICFHFPPTVVVRVQDCGLEAIC